MKTNYTDLALVCKAILLLVLGTKCAHCGGTLLSGLEVDHKNSRDWQPRDYNSLCRALKYMQEYTEGIELRVLCRRCNAIDGAKRGNAWWYG